MRYRILVLIITLAIMSCVKSPFDTRNSQEPAGSTGTWETPATPEALLLNFLFAYNEMNIQNYQLCLDDDFRFSSEQDSIEAESEGNGYLYRFWDKPTDVLATENAFNSFKAENRRLDLILAPAQSYEDSLGDSLSVLYRDYTVRLIDIDSLSADTLTIEGTTSFSVRRSSLFSLWSIYLWSEISLGSSEYNWADLKAEYRN